MKMTQRKEGKRANVDFLSGKAVYDATGFLEGNSLKSALWHDLKEDLLQVEYPGGVILDMGFYPEGNKERGRFRVCVIKGGDWMNPAFSKRFKSPKQMERHLNVCARVAQRASENE